MGRWVVKALSLGRGPFHDPTNKNKKTVMKNFATKNPCPICILYLFEAGFSNFVGLIISTLDVHADLWSCSCVQNYSKL